MSERQLATIRRISALLPIEGADKIEVAVIDGWKVVVKKGDFQVNELVTYLEIDSWVPHAIAPFLTKSGHYPKVYKGVEGQRLKTVKLRGQLSQGLVLPFSILNFTQDGVTYESLADEGCDVTDILGILKWERDIPANLQGMIRGNFPAGLPKTDQERIQNLKNFDKLKEDHVWERTEKLHGCSATYYLDMNNEFHVCSRNINLKDEEGNTYWNVARKYNIEEKLRNLCEAHDHLGVAIQGEIVGPGINGNQYHLNECEFYVFDLYDVKSGTYCPAPDRVAITHALGLKHVPTLGLAEIPLEATKDELLAQAVGESQLNGSEREGIVWKSVIDPSISFKVISDVWLLNGGE